ncbi:MAG: hypothetical protein R2932_33410 [Caldilineaceae bacterium]
MTINSSTLATTLLREWQKIRQETYAYLTILEPHHLDLRLPFPESQTLGYQFWCMVGAHESYMSKLEYGSWQGFASSLDQVDQVTPRIIQQQMQQADARLAELLTTVDLTAPLDNGEPRYTVLFQLINHEKHHHGQLINFMFCHHLPIPPGWEYAA